MERMLRQLFGMSEANSSEFEQFRVPDSLIYQITSLNMLPQNFSCILKSQVKGIDSGFTLSELPSSRGGSTNAVVNVAAIKFRFGVVVLTEKDI